MDILLKGAVAHNGFLLAKEVNLKASINVLTGKNGSGKSRLMESIQRGFTELYFNGSKVEPQSVRHIEHTKFTPQFGSGHNELHYQNRVTATLQLFDRVKQDLEAPLDSNKIRQYQRHTSDGGLSFEQLHRLCSSIASKLGKRVVDLTHDDISFGFEEPTSTILGLQNFSTTVNQYLKRVNKNTYNEWLRTEKGADVTFFGEQEFYEKYGGKPWLLLDDILRDTFDGKFTLTYPDESSMSYDYRANLLLSKDSSVVAVEHLSTGEKTLLWFALTLFNTQYYDEDVSNAPKVLLIDEPDAFLHPKMVLKMYQTLGSFVQKFHSIVLMTTHSPTTVALAPFDSLYLIENDVLSVVEKDTAISDLLDGVNQISISPENRRQVFVESHYDANVYQCLYAKLAGASSRIDSKVSVTFVSSGAKMPKQQLIDKVKQILGERDTDLIDEFVESVNGVGSCSHVIGQVESLVEGDNDSVRGIIDWDLSNAPTDKVAVLAKDLAYSIENLALDPVSISILLHVDRDYSMSDICGKEVYWGELLTDEELRQEAVDRFILGILKRPNRKDKELNYCSGEKVLTDSEYLMMNGHDLETLIKKQYPKLNHYCRKGKDGELKYSVVSKGMLSFTNGRLIPQAFEEVIATIQA